MTKGDKMTDTKEKDALAAAEARAAAAEARLATLEEERGEVEVLLPNTPEEAAAYLGDELLQRQAMSESKRESKEHLKEFGLPMFQPGSPEHRAYLAEAKERLVREAVENRSRGANVTGPRTLKMINPETGRMIQVPIDEQFSNNASMKDNPPAHDGWPAVLRAKEKGYRVMKPMNCLVSGCWLDATPIRVGLRTISDYCSLEHVEAKESFDPSGRRLALGRVG